MIKNIYHKAKKKKLLKTDQIICPTLNIFIMS